jgi:hypothetical protein
MVQIPHVERKQSHSSVWADMKEGINALFENKTLLTPTVV